MRRRKACSVSFKKVFDALVPCSGVVLLLVCSRTYLWLSTPRLCLGSKASCLSSAEQHGVHFSYCMMQRLHLAVLAAALRLQTTVLGAGPAKVILSWQWDDAVGPAAWLYLSQRRAESRSATAESMHGWLCDIHQVDPPLVCRKIQSYYAVLVDASNSRRGLCH